MSERQAPPTPGPAPPRRRWNAVSIGVVWLLAPIVAVLVVGFLYLQVLGWRVSHWPSASMLPGVLPDDFFFVDTRAYSDGRLPRRGDLVVFHAPPQASFQPPASGTRPIFLNRIVGIPGDQVRMENGVPVVNGRALVQEVAGQYSDDSGFPRRKATLLRERLPDGVVYDVMKLEKAGNLDNVGPFKVPEGRYFLLGNNRDNSIDSRVTLQGLGPGWTVPLADIIGKPNYVFWSGFDRLDRIGMALK